MSHVEEAVETVTVSTIVARLTTQTLLAASPTHIVGRTEDATMSSVVALAKLMCIKIMPP